MTQPHPTSLLQDQPTPPCEPASETETPATSSGRFARVMDRLSRSALMRKIAALEWIEVVGMWAGLTLIATTLVGIVLVMGPAAVIVLAIAVPAGALTLLGVLLVKAVVRWAGDE